MLEYGLLEVMGLGRLPLLHNHWRVAASNLEHPEVLTSFHSKTLLCTVGNVYKEV